MVSSMFQIRLKVAANLSIIYYLIFTNLIRYYMVTYQVNDPKKRYTGENSLKSEEIQYSKVFVSAMEECYFYHYKYNIRSENKLFFKFIFAWFTGYIVLFIHCFLLFWGKNENRVLFVK